MSTACPPTIGSAPNFVGSLHELADWTIDSRNVKGAIERAARRIGLSYWRTFDIWYGKARRIEPAERAAIATALDRKRQEAARNELHELRVRLARLEALLAQTDESFHRPEIDAARAMGGTLGHGPARPKRP